MKLFKATAAALLVGTATLSVAQTTQKPMTAEQSFADQLKTMQSLQSFGTYTFKAPPALGAKPSPSMASQSFADSFADMQAASSSSGQWSQTPNGATAYANRPADPVGKESFAQVFQRMQSASSNSGEWKGPTSDAQSAYAASSRATTAH